MEAKEVDIELYRAGIKALEDSKIFKFLQPFGAVQDQGIHPEMASANFAEARRSFGFNQLYAMLVNFQQVFLAPKIEGRMPPMAFGSLEAMLKNKEINQEQYDKLAASPTFNRGR